jgi:hypothetical protein
VAAVAASRRFCARLAFPRASGTVLLTTNDDTLPDAASIEKLIARYENEIVDLRAEKAHVTAIVDTFPPIIADLTDEIRQSHGRGAERWEGNERRRDRR